MRRLLLCKFQRAGIFSGDGCDAEFYRGFVAVRAVGIQPLAAGKQSRQPRGVREQRPDFLGGRGQRGWPRKFPAPPRDAPPRSASMARAIARRVKTRAISRRYSAEACRSESGSTPWAALCAASSTTFAEVALPLRACSTASARNALAASPVIPMA